MKHYRGFTAKELEEMMNCPTDPVKDDEYLTALITAREEMLRHMREQMSHFKDMPLATRADESKRLTPREEFERWMKPRGRSLEVWAVGPEGDRRYKNWAVQLAWEAWTASRKRMLSGGV
jgi:hypothetical protein